MTATRDINIVDVGVALFQKVRGERVGGGEGRRRTIGDRGGGRGERIGGER